MGRRASSSINATAIVGIIAVIAILVGVGFIILNRKGETFEDVAPLLVQEALENGNSLRGNEYRVEGKLLTRWPREEGAVVEILVEETGKSTHFPIIVPANVSSVNFEREQRYAFKIKFGDGGVAIATDVKRL
ncbi:MAG: hypothetical protein OSA48_08290 [Akkermansiaceae bacterium]|jgi:hypothetical protein|nr:hypothetical protein [Akkermansiaceae bacterium]|tara:strand:- start:59 stop:457 length:399 start_codon:yes stop_codon:yes gene_type:complete